jgi:hypothetical protein
MPSELDLQLERLARSTLRTDRIGLIEAEDLPALLHLTSNSPALPAQSGQRRASPAPLPARRPCRGPRRASLLVSLPWPAECAVERPLTARKATRPSSEPIKRSAGRVLDREARARPRTSLRTRDFEPLPQFFVFSARTTRSRKGTHGFAAVWEERGDLLAAPPSPPISSVYGVGSVPDQPKMSVLPNLAAQSCCGAGRGTSSLSSSVRSDIRQASMAGQSAAFRASFHTAAP